MGGGSPCFNPETVISMANCAVLYIYFGNGVLVGALAHAPDAKPMTRPATAPGDIQVVTTGEYSYAVISGVEL